MVDNIEVDCHWREVIGVVVGINGGLAHPDKVDCQGFRCTLAAKAAVIPREINDLSGRILK